MTADAIVDAHYEIMWIDGKVAAAVALLSIFCFAWWRLGVLVLALLKR